MKTHPKQVFLAVWSSSDGIDVLHYWSDASRKANTAANMRESLDDMSVDHSAITGDDLDALNILLCESGWTACVQFEVIDLTDCDTCLDASPFKEFLT